MSNATLPPSLHSFLGTHSALGQRLRQNAQAPSPVPFLPGLPAAVAAKTRAQIVDNELLLIAETNAVAQMLRFHGPGLAREAGVTSFSVRVLTPPEPLTRPSTLTPPTLDAAAASILQEAARSCDYAPLAAALDRLARLGQLSTPPSDPKD